MPIPKPPFHPAVAEPYILGTDVSRYSDLRDWPQLREDECRFMFGQSSYGQKRAAKFVEHVTGAHAADVTEGAYHYLTNGHATEQASLYIATVNEVEQKIGRAVALALDVEDPFKGAPWPREEYEETAAQWLDLVCAYFERPIVQYIGPDFARQLRLRESFGKHPLWVSHYETRKPTVPAPWFDYSIWQYQGGEEDWNVARMSVDDYRAMMGLT